jgi:orotidine-5'-phosphate decarboxylase
MTSEHVGMFKVGLTNYISGGSSVIAELAELKPVFLDLKLHDIP